MDWARWSGGPLGTTWRLAVACQLSGPGGRLPTQYAKLVRSKYFTHRYFYCLKLQYTDEIPVEIDVLEIALYKSKVKATLGAQFHPHI
eukprot:491680-Prymnesium_polylepis.1